MSLLNVYHLILYWLIQYSFNIHSFNVIHWGFWNFSVVVNKDNDCATIWRGSGWPEALCGSGMLTCRWVKLPLHGFYSGLVQSTWSSKAATVCAWKISQSFRLENQNSKAQELCTLRHWGESQHGKSRKWFPMFCLFRFFDLWTIHV